MSDNFRKNKRVIVTEGAGVLGSFLVEQPARRGAADILVPRIDHYNLAAGEDVARLTFDTTKPNGQPLRGLDAGRAEQSFGFRAHTPFEESLRRTIEWYESSRK
jgi:nucleoside-diphosphate-sugar epimerase